MFDYKKKVTAWEDSGTEPPEGLRKWQAGEKPPAAWWNWFWDAAQKCFEDIRNWINRHQDANTGVHGVGTGHIETTEGAQTKVNSAISVHIATSDPHSQYANKTIVNEAFSNDSAVGHNHNGVGMGAPIPGSAIVGAVAQATSAATSTLAEAAKGDTRFQMTLCNYYADQIPASTAVCVSSIYVPLAIGKKLVLKHIRCNLSSYFSLRFLYISGYHEILHFDFPTYTTAYTATVPGSFVDSSSSVLKSYGDGIDNRILMFIYNTSQDSSYNYPSSSTIWLDLAIEDIPQ